MFQECFHSFRCSLEARNHVCRSSLCSTCACVCVLLMSHEATECVCARGRKLRWGCFSVLTDKLQTNSPLLLAPVMISALLFYLHEISNPKERRLLGRRGDAERSQDLVVVATAAAGCHALMFGINIQMQKVAFGCSNMNIVPRKRASGQTPHGNPLSSKRKTEN